MSAELTKLAAHDVFVSVDILQLLEAFAKGLSKCINNLILCLKERPSNLDKLILKGLKSIL